MAQVARGDLKVGFRCVCQKGQVAAMGVRAGFFQHYFKRGKMLRLVKCRSSPCLLCSLLGHRAISRTRIRREREIAAASIPYFLVAQGQAQQGTVSARGTYCIFRYLAKHNKELRARGYILYFQVPRDEQSARVHIVFFGYFAKSVTRAFWLSRRASSELFG